MQEIVCAVCGRRTPDATRVCPSCGAPLTAPVAVAPTAAPVAEDDSATRPAIPPIAVTARPAVALDTSDDESTKAALPVSLSLTAFEPSGADDANTQEVTADYPMAPAPERTRTVPPPALPTTEPSSPSASRKRRPLRALALSLLILLLIAVGAAAVLYANGRLPSFGATATPTLAATMTPLPTATPVSNMTLFTDADHVFSIGYPAGWLMTTQNAAGSQQRLVIFSNPNTGANVNIGTLATTDTPARQIAEQTLAVVAQKTGIANRSGPALVRIGGEMWTQESGVVTLDINKQPTPVQATALAIIHGNHTIYMLTLAPVSSAATIQPTFQQMLQSFQFLP